MADIPQTATFELAVICKFYDRNLFLKEKWLIIIIIIIIIVIIIIIIIIILLLLLFIFIFIIFFLHDQDSS